MKSTLMMMLFVACLANVSVAAQNVVVLLDDSGSMEENMRNQQVRRIDAAKDALLTVLNQVPEDGNIGVLALNGRSGQGEWIIDLGPVDKSQIQNAVAKIRARGGTPLGEFMKQAADALLQLREKQYYGTYRLLVVTDGEANDAAYLEAILPDVLRRNIMVDVIGVDMKTDHSLATKVDNYRRADDRASLQQAISESLAEVASGTPATTAGESDYELLDGLPDGVASAVIAALVTNENTPVAPQGENLESPRDRGQNVFPMTPPSSSPSGGFGPIGFVIFLLIVVVAILSKVFSGVNSAGRRS